MMAMKRIVIPALLIMAISVMARPAASSQTPQNAKYFLRTDTVTVLDTIITRKLVKRTELVQLTEEVVVEDTVRVGESFDELHLPVSTTPTVVEVESPGIISIPAPAEVVTVHKTRRPGMKTGVVKDTVKERVPIITADTVRLAETVYIADTVSRPGGSFVWVPDSMNHEVSELLDNKGRIAADKGVVNFNEKVTFRGDTIPMVLRDRNLGRYSRGLLNYLYIPKGIWSIGVTASYGEFSTSDLEVLDLLSDIDLGGHMFSIRPYFSYFIRNNMSVGLRLGYTSGKANINSFKVDIDEDMNFNLHDIAYNSESYTAAVTFNQYFGIARRGRFGIFNEVELAFSSGRSDFIRPYNDQLKQTHTNTTQVGLNFSPGVSVFIMDPVSFNVSFGVFGVNLKNEKQTVDGEDMGSRFTSGANFRFNIFNINFGVAVNL
jgi:hypothetical protein